MLTMTDLCGGVPNQHVLLHTPPCGELGWIERIWMSEGCPHTMGRAEQWFCLLEMCFCVLQEQRGSAFSHLQLQADAREEGQHLSSGGLKLLTAAGWKRQDALLRTQTAL